MKATDQIELKFVKDITEKLKVFEEKHGWIDYIIAPFIVTVILLVIYGIKGVYPFGPNTIAYYDMPTNTVTGFTHFWDLLHGKIGLFTSWYIPMGISSYALNGFLVPVNYFFLFISRDSILYSMSFFLIFVMSLCSVTMSVYYKKHFLDTTGTVCAGILYAFSGYSLQYYTNIDFLNFVMIFPLIVWTLERLIKEHKFIAFTFLMAIVTTWNIQLVFMIYVYILFKSFFIISGLEENDKGRALRLLAASLLLSVVMAMIVQLPNTMVLGKSTRASLSGSFDYVDQMRNVYSEFRKHKQFIMYGCEMGLGALLLMIFKGPKDLKKYKSNIFMLLILGLPILHEGINKLWHLGSYKHFPVRFGYMLVFEFILFVGEFISNGEPVKIKYISKFAKILGFAMIPFIAYVLYGYFDQFIDQGIHATDAYASYWIFLLTLTGAFFLAFIMETGQSRKGTLILLVLIQAFCGCYGLIAPKTSNRDNFRIQYVLNSIELRKQLGGTADYCQRIKSDPADYESNYTNITDQPALSYWSYSVSPDTEAEMHENLGYDGQQSYLMDTGGTVFSDALLGVTRYASLHEPDKMLYSEEDGKEGVYRANYTMPFGIVTKDPIEDSKDILLKHHNNLFKSITGINETLIDISSASEYLTETKKMNVEDVYDVNMKLDAENSLMHSNVNVLDDEPYATSEEDKEGKDEVDTGEVIVNTKEYDLTIPVKGRSSLYLDLNGTLDTYIVIFVNDKPYLVDSVISYGSYNYPNALRNKILALGSYEDTNINLKIYTEAENIDNLEIGLLDLDTLRRGIEAVGKNQKLEYVFSKNSMHITGKTATDGMLFLPFGYINGWRAEVNGVKTEVKPYINNAFIGIEVPEGDVDITLSYRPKGLFAGIALSVAGILLFVLLILFMKRGGIKGWKYEKLADKIFIYGYMAVFLLFLFAMYIVPIYLKMAL